MHPCILYSNKNAGFICFNRVCYQVTGTGLTLAACLQIKLVIMPWTNDLTQIIDMAFA